MRKWQVAASVALLHAGSALAVDVRFPAAKFADIPEVGEVRANLELPPGGAERGRVPAVVVLHGSNGIDGRGEFYAKALNEAGIGTLEVVMFGRNLRPTNMTWALPYVFGGLIYLATHPIVDPERIGVMGFSYGGGLSIISASTVWAERLTAGKFRFAAHAPLYPVCSAHLRAAVDSSHPRFSAYQTFTGRPMLILAAGKDNYEPPDSCEKFIASLPAAARPSVSLTLYPTATHAWDTRDGGRTFRDPAARDFIVVRPNAQIAAESQRAVTEFFVQHLLAGTRAERP